MCFGLLILFATTTGRSTLLFAMTTGVFWTTAMVFNEAKLSTMERSRLYSRGLGYCDTSLFPKMRKMPEYSKMPKSCALNEDSTVMDEAKFRPKSYHCKDPKHMQSLPCWYRAYMNGYGGGESLGEEFYEGTVGGHFIVCPSTGEKHHKLYATLEQFPVALLQFLVHVESGGHRCGEIYVYIYVVKHKC